MSEVIRSDIPARVDRLPWSPFHTRMVLALGICWILDGFEIMILASLGEHLSQSHRLGLDVSSSSLAAVYLVGQVVGALVFGQLSDRLGRRRLFFLTLTIYFIGSALTAFVIGNGTGWLVFLYLTRFIAGAGIGGEYAAINSAIDELIPARHRGQVDIAVNGTYWAGAAIAGAVQLPLLSGAIDPDYDWRIAVLIGPLLAIFIAFLRRNVPESPRWQIMHGRRHDAEKSIETIEQEVMERSGKTLHPVDDSHVIDIQPVNKAGYLTLLRVLFQTYPERSVLSAVMMITQSFLYNAIFFTYASVLTKLFDVPETEIPIYFIAFAIGNLLGPLVLGPLFDKIGRRKMISRTYVWSGFLLLASAFIFKANGFTATTQTLVWCVIFFFASAGASSAYLTVSEIFPMEVRAKAIAVFFAIAQCFGALGIVTYEKLADNPNPSWLFSGYLVAAVIMIIGGVVASRLAIDAENKSLEDVATPLSVVAAEGITRPTTLHPPPGESTT